MQGFSRMVSQEVDRRFRSASGNNTLALQPHHEAAHIRDNNNAEDSNERVSSGAHRIEEGGDDGAG